MNFKRLVATGAAAALMLSSALPVFANDDNLLVLKNRAHVRNITVSVANTGANNMNAGEDVEGSRIETGRALAVTDVLNDVNHNNASCGCEDDSRTIIKNSARVKNFTVSIANTGRNTMTAGDDVEEGGVVVSGGAEASSIVTNVVNTNTITGEVDD